MKNGLLLRSDIHTLFDLKKLPIDDRYWTCPQF
ncbi:MAG: HNH endonuclease [Acidobacteriota bacterium]|nr:HNH endonuclease [Acidobacteriota bacterium]